MSITIVEGRGILGGFDASLREYAERRFKRDRITIRAGSNVVRVEDGKARAHNTQEAACTPPPPGRRVSGVIGLNGAEVSPTAAGPR